MQARSRKIIFPSGIQIQTPLLIPSFSSRGFNLPHQNQAIIYNKLQRYKKFLKESLLVSSYDLYYKHIPSPSAFAAPSCVSFIDSGGYEQHNLLANDRVAKAGSFKKPWNIELQNEILHKWPKKFPGITVNYDLTGQLLEKQIDDAFKQFNRFPSLLNDFLIKPEPKSKGFIPLKKIINNPALLADFNIIGVAEKELGSSMYLKMVAIAKIRTCLDEAGNDAPIHVFGSLDPITSVLLFFAGAEIFDGLSWLRYAYNNGYASYIPNAGILNYGIKMGVKTIEQECCKNNINYLMKLKNAMIAFTITKNFSEFDQVSSGIGKMFENWYLEFKNHSETE